MIRILFAFLLPFILMTSLSAEDATSPSNGQFRHIVLLSFKDSATPEEVTDVEKAFAALPEKIDTITAFEWGTDLSPENRAKGFTHCFLVTFKDRAGLEAYLPHDAHQAFVAKLKPVLEDVLVFDYATAP